MNLDSLRADFPLLHRSVHQGKTLVYLDSAASSQKPQMVLDAMDAYYRTSHANVHRGMHALAEEATAAFESARLRIAAFLGAGKNAHLIFTKGTTEAINLVAHSYPPAYMKPGECILLTGMEHHSNLVPWQLAAARLNLRLAFIPVTPAGLLDLPTFHRLLASENPRLVALTHVSNALGTINPIDEIIQAAHQIGAHVLIDAAQSVPHMPINFEALGADFLAFSGHKLCGPTGIGGLVAKTALLEKMPPFLGGGEMINRVTLEKSTWADLPYKFEAGTPAIAEAIGLGAAVDYLSSIGMTAIREHVESLSAAAVERLRTIPGIRLIGESPVRGGAVSFVVNGIHPHDIAQCVDQEGVAVRAGHLCCQPLMEHFGIPAVTRASFYLYNTHEEIDTLERALRMTLKLFGHG